MLSKIVQFILLSFIFIYLFYGFEINKIDMSKFSVLGILFSFLIILISQIFLSIRWMKMSNLSFKISFETIIVSSALNMILPAKLGEFSKAFYLKKFYKYNYHKVISIILVERFFDVIVLFLLLCIWTYNYAVSDLIKYFIIVLSLVIVGSVLFFNSKKSLFILKKIPVQFLRVYTQKIFKKINEMFKSILSLSFYTIILWFTYFLSTVVFFIYAVDFNLNINTILGLFVFSTIAMSIPLAPAGIGTYEGVVVLFLNGNYGIGKEDALLAATLFHILLFIVDFLLLYMFLFIKEIKLKELIK